MISAGVLAIGGASYVEVSAISGGGLSAAGSGSAAGLGSGRGSNARSGPAAGGTSGTVADMSPSSFTVTTSAGQKVTINEASATKHLTGTSSASANGVAAGDGVLVLGITDSTAITATEVIVQPAGSAAKSATAIVVS
jgi:Domain of unknown function (DUF5666)